MDMQYFSWLQLFTLFLVKLLCLSFHKITNINLKKEKSNILKLKQSNTRFRELIFSDNKTIDLWHKNILKLV